MGINKKFYLKYSAQYIDVKENIFYNITYVAKDIKRVDFSRYISRIEKQTSEFTISAKTQKGDNEKVFKLITDNEHDIIVYREVFIDSNWVYDILNKYNIGK